MDQNDRLLRKFDYNPLDKFCKVRVEHAFDFLDPAKVSKQSSESAVALPNALIDEAERTYDASMFFTAEQRRRAALVPPIHVALNHLSDAALIELYNTDTARTSRKGNLTRLRGVTKLWSVKTSPRLLDS